MADDSFIHLVDGYLDGKLDKNDLRKFLAMIEESPENREILAQNALISRLIVTANRAPVSAEQILMTLPRHGNTAKLIIDQIRNSEEPVVQTGGNKVLPIRKNGLNGQKKTTFENRKYGIKEETGTPGIVYFFRTLTALAACALITFGVWRHMHQPATSPGTSLALLDCHGDVTIERGNQAIPAPVNAIIYNGDTIVVGAHAMAMLRYNDENTTLKLQEGSVLRLENVNGAKNLFLNHGAVIASVSPQPEISPMTITTPKACIAVIGTKFSLKTTEVATLLDVDSGKVRVTRGSDNSSIEVSTGNRVEVNDNTPLSMQPAQNTVLGHLGRKQVEEMFQTMSTVKAWGINTLTFDITSLDEASFPQGLRSAIATAHRANVKFYAKLDIPQEIAKNYDTFMNRTKTRLPQLVLDYNFDGIYVVRPLEMKDNNQFKHIMSDVYRAVNNTGVSIETGAQRDVSTNETWFIGY